MSSKTPKATDLARKIIGRLIKAASIVTVGIAILTFVTRLYFTNERLRSILTEELSSKLQTAVEIQEFNLNFLNGIQIKEFQIGPPTGFIDTPLRWDELNIHWDLISLLQFKFIIPEVSLINPRISLEKQTAQTNIQALLAPLSAAETKSPAPPSNKPQEKASLKQPTLPVFVSLEKVVIQNATIQARLPDGFIRIPNLSLHTSFKGENQELQLNNKLTLGQKNKPASILVKQRDNQLAIETSSTLTFNSNGLTNNRIEWSINANAAASLEEQGPFPIVPMRGKLSVDIDLLSQTLSIPEFKYTVGQTTRFALSTHVASLFDDPKIHIQQCEFSSQLDDFQNLIPVFVPGAKIGGTVSLGVNPIQFRLSELQSPHQLSLKVPYDLKNLNLSLKHNLLQNLNVSGELNATGEEFRFSAATSIDSLVSGENTIRDTKISVTAATPSAAWFGSKSVSPSDSIALGVRGSTAQITSPAAKIQRTSFAIDNSVPIELIQKAVDSQPIRTKIEFEANRINTPQASIKRTRFDIDTRVFDLEGKKLTAEMQFLAKKIRAGATKGKVQLPQITLKLDVLKEDQTIELTRSKLSLSNLSTLSLKLKLTDILSPRPLLRTLRLQTSPLDFKKALKLLPPSLRPNLQASGKASLKAHLSGRFDPLKLMKQAQPPSIPELMSQKAWETAINRYARFISTWLNRLDQKLAFKTDFEAKLSNLSLTLPAQSVTNLNASLRAKFPYKKPKITFAFSADSIKSKPSQTALEITHAEDVGGEFSLQLNADTLKSTGQISYGRLSAPGLPIPLQKGLGEFKGSYQFGGDLLIEQAQFQSAGISLGAQFDGIWVDPLQALMSRAWLGNSSEKIKLNFNWKLYANLSPPLKLAPPDTSVSGAVETSGTARLKRNLFSLTASTSFNEFHIQRPMQTIENLSGSIPLQLSVSFSPVPNGIIVARNLPTQFGKLWLVATPQDIRDDSTGAIFQERLKAYKPSSGLRIDRITSGKHEIKDFKFEGQLNKGILKADEISMHILGGDIIGQAGFQLSSKQEFIGAFRFQASNMDASYFQALDLEPGPESELSADFSAQFLFGPRVRDLEADMNVTKIGPDTLDRFLQLLDPEKSNPAIQDYRRYLPLITLDEVALWIKHENMNMDLLYTTLLRIPGTQIGFRPIDREMIRRFSLSELVIDPYMQKSVDQYIGPLLGWNK